MSGGGGGAKKTSLAAKFRIFWSSWMTELGVPIRRQLQTELGVPIRRQLQ